MNFKISSIDSCLFFSQGIIFIFYVDNGIIVSDDPKKIISFIKDLRQCGLDLGIEEDYAGYLGVEIKNDKDGLLFLTQTGLIEQFIADLGLAESPSFK